MGVFDANERERQMGYVKANQKCRVLLVEDHADTRLIIARLLTKHGYEILSASCLQEALAICDAALPDVLLADLQLPDGSGFDLIRQLKSRGSIRCIALTGHGMPDDILKTKNAGFDAHLTKPVSIEKLHAVLRQACEEFASETP
jgi:CheY-like chemotaxis protein